MRILEPLSGTIFVAVGGKIPVVKCIAESKHETLTVNGIPAKMENDRFILEIPLEKTYQELNFASGGETACTHVWRADTDRRIFRVSVDDNIRFLQDIAERDYNSIFENPYLAMYRSLHEKYGVKIHMNIYWESPEYGTFTLPQLSDRYKQEWLDNRNWLHLSFHARADKPDWPYLHAGYQKVYDDCLPVMREIRRFAGKVGHVTTLHFAETGKDGIRALYDCGIRVLLGDYTLDANGNPYICYGATCEQYNAVRKHCFWKDPETKMIFCPCDLVLNTGELSEVRSTMDEFERKWPNRAFVDILIHEQYFYSDYRRYLPDYRRRLEEGIEWCLENGYAPGFIDEILPETCPPVAGI